MLGELREPLRGAHTFRQAHVAANIDKYVAHGLSLRPATYNVDVPGALFDFPLYQLAVAGLCRALGLPGVPTARALNIALFAAALGVAASLLLALGARAAERAFALGFFAWSPLNLFYWPTPFVDPLGVLLALLSLRGYLAWDARGARSGYTAMLAAGLLATLIKNPLYLPFLAGMGWHRLRRRGARALLAPAFLAFVGALAAAVVLFKLYSNHVNHSGAFLMPDEAQAYFGSWADRLRRKHWRALVESLTEKVLPSAAGALALGGLLSLRRRGGGSRRPLAAALGVGVALTLALFFGRHYQHDYYQLPFVFPAALLAGLGARRLLVLARAARLSGRPALRWAALGALVAAVGASALGAHATWREMRDTPGPAELLARGEWIQAHTRAADFVALVVGIDEHNWDPSHLWFARRDGCNLAVDEVTLQALRDLRAGPARTHARLLLFVPWPQREALARTLGALGARPLAEGHLGDLYDVEPAGLSR